MSWWGFSCIGVVRRTHKLNGGASDKLRWLRSSCRGIDDGCDNKGGNYYGGCIIIKELGIVLGVVKWCTLQSKKCLIYLKIKTEGEKKKLFHSVYDFEYFRFWSSILRQFSHI